MGSKQDQKKRASSEEDDEDGTLIYEVYGYECEEDFE